MRVRAAAQPIRAAGYKNTTHVCLSQSCHQLGFKLWPQQCLDGAAFVHRAIGLRDLIQRKGRIKYLTGIDFSVPHQLDQVRQVPADWSRTSMETDEVEKHRPHVELHSMGHADISNGATRPSRSDGLHHGFLCADALQHRIGSDAVGQVLDPGYSLIAELSYDDRRAKLACELLTFVVPAHHDEAFRAHLFGWQCAQ